ncbi:MAG: hypothetical protein FWD08_08415 [Alphaproteobacteria bacterium]|nr:hypothetical protein [Alphaproteobacteria bacterium]
MKVTAELRSLFSGWHAPGVVVAAILFTYLQWQGLSQLRDFASEGKNLPSCLKVSDFYSVHLTSFYLPTALDDDADPREKAMRYKQFCDHIPGPGKVIFTVDLMEDDARAQSVQLSLLRYDRDGHLALVKLLPPNLHPHGVLTLETPIAEAGKYLLKVAFGDAKTQDDIIEMPISVEP